MAQTKLQEEKLLGEIRSWVTKIYSNADHLLRTEYWLFRLNPKVDLASRIAALTHDIERAFEDGRKPPSPEIKSARWDDPVYNKWHGERSADLTCQKLEGLKVRDRSILNKTKRLIRLHEFGGDSETDLVKDADSLSFLEINVPLFISRIPTTLTKEEAREKFDYMFGRITSAEAKNQANPLYRKALNKLNKL
ncbi:DUF4202 domain-containing protein [Candidatus Shapirobacteria bacterium]|nr:DUF4202 domain-containing protein [Candidatus Shapirobacteria bacterium]